MNNPDAMESIHRKRDVCVSCNEPIENGEYHCFLEVEGGAQDGE